MSSYLLTTGSQVYKKRWSKTGIIVWSEKFEQHQTVAVIILEFGQFEFTVQ